MHFSVWRWKMEGSASPLVTLQAAAAKSRDLSCMLAVYFFCCFAVQSRVVAAQVLKGGERKGCFQVTQRQTPEQTCAFPYIYAYSTESVSIDDPANGDSSIGYLFRCTNSDVLELRIALVLDTAAPFQQTPDRFQMGVPE